MIAPVIHADASDARSTASPWISSGTPSRPAGIRAGTGFSARDRSPFAHSSGCAGWAPARAVWHSRVRHGCSTRCSVHASSERLPPWPCYMRCAHARGPSCSQWNRCSRCCPCRPRASAGRQAGSNRSARKPDSGSYADLFQCDIFRAASHSVARHVEQDVHPAEFRVQPAKHLVKLRWIGDVAAYYTGPAPKPLDLRDCLPASPPYRNEAAAANRRQIPPGRRLWPGPTRWLRPRQWPRALPDQTVNCVMKTSCISPVNEVLTSVSPSFANTRSR